MGKTFKAHSNGGSMKKPKKLKKATAKQRSDALTLAIAACITDGLGPGYYAKARDNILASKGLK